VSAVTLRRREIGSGGGAEMFRGTHAAWRGKEVRAECASHGEVREAFEDAVHARRAMARRAERRKCGDLPPARCYCFAGYAMPPFLFTYAWRMSMSVAALPFAVDTFVLP